jgi:hypothetical protein
LKPALKPQASYRRHIKFNQRIIIVKNKLALIALSVQKINRRHIHLIFVVLTLSMLVLGAGAPSEGGSTGH